MNTELKNKAAYDLTLEYIRQNSKMKASSETTLENFKKIYDEIFQYLSKLS